MNEPQGPSGPHVLGTTQVEAIWTRYPRTRNVALAVGGVAAALAIRRLVLHVEGQDYREAFAVWWAFIVDNGHFAALQHDFADYNVTYLYLLAAFAKFLPGLHSLLAVKAISIFFDFVMAYFAYKCVGLKYRDSNPASVVPVVAGIVVLLAPSVVINSSALGQSDATYTAFLVACLYYLLAGRQGRAMLAFGLAVVFKQQAVFLAPLFLCLLARGQLQWRYFAWPPLVFVAVLVPAWFIGRPFVDLLLIYWDQVWWHNRLSMHAPNLYAWIPNTYYKLFPLGVAFSAGVVLLLAAAVRKSAAKLTAELTVLLATCSVLIVPYTLPKMHDRYYYPADVIAIVLAFYMPRYWYVPVTIGAVSTSMAPGWWPDVAPIVSISTLAFVPTALIALLAWQLYRELAPFPRPLLEDWRSMLRF